MIKENTHYFDHDYNAQNDPKIEAMLFEKGWEGYGIFWAIVEKLAQEPCHKLLKLYDRIAFVLRTKFETVKSVIEDYELFSFNETHFWSERLNKHFEKRLEKSLKAKESISKRWGKNTTVLQTNYESNTIKEKKVKESKDKSNKLDLIEKKTKKEFIRPTLDELKEYSVSTGLELTPESFLNSMEEKGWMRGKKEDIPVLNWKATYKKYNENAIKWGLVGNNQVISGKQQAKQFLTSKEKVKNAIIESNLEVVGVEDVTNLKQKEMEFLGYTKKIAEPESSAIKQY